MLNDKFNSQSLELGYNLTLNDWNKYGGKGLLLYFNDSLSTALQSIFPNHIWQTWKFNESVESGFWDTIKNSRKFMDNLGKKLEYKSIEDWYKIKEKDIQDNQGGTLLKKYNNTISKLIESIYPEYKWDSSKFSSSWW